MILSSIDFIIFFFLLLLILNFAQKFGDDRKKDILIGASYFFYGYWNVKALLLVVFVSLGNYLFGELLSNERYRKKSVLFLSIFFNLCILGYFKYFNFFIDSIRSLFPHGADQLHSLKIIMPVGISFYIFQAMTYPIDIYQKRIESASLRDVALYISFFPKITVGPIATASEFLPQLKKPLALTKENLMAGASLFLLGLVKKSVFADNLAVFVNEVFDHAVLYDAWSILSATVAYSIQIYCDFSGYSDMAIGVAMILGFTLPVNFNYPYKATSVTDFWRRWHISLSSWLRDYLYIPLGGNRRGNIRTYINIFITFFLCGLWHGAGLTYILWGSYHGVGLVLHKIWSAVRINVSESPEHIARKLMKNTYGAMLVTYLFITVGWVLFRSSSVKDAAVIMGRMVTGAGGAHWIHISFYLIVPVCFCWHLLACQQRIKKQLVRFDTLLGLSCVIALVFSVLLLSPLDASPFIYFQF